MIPVRLSLLLAGVVILVLLAIGNPEPVTIRFLFWHRSFELYKIIYGAVFLGVVFTVIYIGHVKYLKRLRGGRYDKEYQDL